MEKETDRSKRGHLGYGSSYRKGKGKDLGKAAGIGAVLGGQVWMVKPDREAAAANPCIWMESGVVRFKACNRYHDCTSCKYDKGMQKKAAEGKQMSWREAMRRKEGLDRVCRHSLTRRIAKRTCAYDYECSRCDFDQFFEDVWTAKTGERTVEVREIKGFQVPMGHYFHQGHAWARIESGGYLRVGMDDFSLKLLGRSDAFDLPLVGKELTRDRVGWGLRRGKNRAEVLSPVDGVITEVNTTLLERPEAANQGPYEQGWLFRVHHPDLKESMKTLMSEAEGIGWMQGEIQTLEDMIEKNAGPLAADGGYLAEDIFGHVPALGWKNLTHTFLRTE